MELYTVKEVSELLKLKPTTVTRLLRLGKLEGTKLGKSYRISDAALKKFIGEDLLRRG